MVTATDSRPKPAPAPPPPPPPPGPEPAQPKENLDYYGYLYEPSKTPTKTLDALLRAIAQYIIDNLADPKDKALKPNKLAAFYKAVGGDYDKLFVNAPQESISYIWQVFGCRHSLEATDSDDDAPWNFDPPTVPALTLRGFVRWESIQILLTPEEHVPFIIYAVKNWNLTNPDTGEPFPTDITAASFPSEPDAGISAWYESCGEKLRKEAAPKASPKPSYPTGSDRDRVHAAFSHVRAPGRAGTPDYFSHHRSVPFAHVSPGHAGRPSARGSGLRVSPERMERAERMRYNGLSPQEERARRRSFSDYPSPNASPGASHSSPHLHPPRPTATRRHSHPRRVDTDPDESESDGDASPDLGRRGSGPYGSGGPHRSPKVVPRFVHIAVPGAGPPGGSSPAVPSSSAVPNLRPEGGAKLRSEDRISPTIPGARRKSGVEGAKDWAKEKISNIFPAASPSERPRKSPGSSSGNIHGTGGGGSRDSLRLGRSRSYDDGNSDTDSEYERERRRRRRARERERRERDAYERDRERDRPSRRSRDDLPDWDQDPRSRSRRDREGGIGGGTRYSRRPENPRRTSSHADVDRLERERMHRYDYGGRETTTWGGGARGKEPEGQDGQSSHQGCEWAKVPGAAARQSSSLKREHAVWIRWGYTTGNKPVNEDHGRFMRDNERDRGWRF